jgi:hypothetical protein
VLWSAGAALAGATGVLSLAHHLLFFAAVYGAVAAGLGFMAVATHRGNRTAEMVSLVGLGGQIVGAVGAGWELHRPDTGNVKARHLHDLGLNYRWALLCNLVYSLLASAVFVWAVVGIRTRRARAPGQRAMP